MWLLTVYVVLCAAPALSSITCPCLNRLHQSSEKSCSCCHRVAPCAEHDLHFKALCTCGHNHSTDVELYTIPSGDEERPTQRVVVIELPEALIGEDIPLDQPLVSFERIRLRVAEGCREGSPQNQSLRAPPVLA